MKRKFIVKESQLKSLIEKKKRNSKILKKINEDIDRINNSMNEGEIINEAIVDTIKKYAKKGLLSAAIISSLLGSGKVSAQQLQQAGVDQNKIEMAQQKTGGDEIKDLKNYEKQLIRVLKRADQVGTINRYENLSQEEKTQLLSNLASRFEKPNDMKNYEFQITDYLSKELSGDQYSEIGQQKKTIEVDTTVVDITKNVGDTFSANSNNIQDVNKLKEDLQEIFNYFESIDSIKIISSSSTLRNTGEAEGKTWKELATERAQAVSNVIEGMSHDLGGCGVNQSKTIDRNIISINSDGENGDGTSGPPSPYERNPDVIEYYKQQGIDASLWDSDAEGEPYKNKEEYKKHQYVKVVVTGDVVESDTDQIVNYKYLVVKLKQDNNVNIKRDSGKTTKQGVKVLACPINK